MPSPFPGMDPYLEGYLWPDVHHALANKIRQQLTPKLRPRYAARLEVYVVEDRFPEGDLGIVYPDVEIMQQRQTSGRTAEVKNPVSTVLVTPASLTLPVVQPVSVRLATVEIRDTMGNILVSCIEILSPVNKREPGLTNYRHKCRRLYEAGVHLLEIDLLRRGTRPFARPQMPKEAYAIALTRAGSGLMDVWSLALKDPLPILPIPLRSPDPDVVLDLSAAMQEVYVEAAYELSINYDEPPPPPALSASAEKWLSAYLKDGGRSRQG